MIGTVYGVMLNDRASLLRLADQFDKDPYKAAPRAPILYIKPANTFTGQASKVPVPVLPGHVQIGATIGAVLGRRATRLDKSNALGHLDGFRVVADISLPHESFYRPAIRERCRDGFCPIGPLAGAAGFDVSKAVITVSINGSTVEQRTLGDSVRPLERLLIDVTEFMTLEAGDVVLLGLSDQPPLARPDDSIGVNVAGLGALDFVLCAEEMLVPR
jgi:5-oxopent-3-ene-1,2,5-tricarboxylate decarboxylase/2-hydroxyhepta-2,4-diene-1,7-dioate isomerase